MPRVHHVNKARKDNPVAKKGESYYWWKFRYGGKHFSLTPPKASQLTQSPYLSVIYDCQEQWSKLDDPSQIEADQWDRSYIVSWLGEIANSMDAVRDNLYELVDQYEESATNMEEYFSGSERVDQLRECGMACEETCSEIENMVQSCQDTALEIDSIEEPEDEDDDDAMESFNIEMQDAIDQIEFDEPNFDFHEL